MAAPIVQAPCFCRGRNQRCHHCDGTGTVPKRGCIRCDGKGTQGGERKCPDCRGQGWRELDNMTTEI